MTNAEMFLLILLKKLPVFFAIAFGAVAHIMDETRTVGWKGWVYAFSTVIACCFVGYSFYHFSFFILLFFPNALQYYPDLPVFFASIGSFWGTKGFIFIRDIFIDTISTFVNKNYSKNSR